MLCRVFLAAAVFTCTLSRGTRPPTLDYIKDVLCVLLLSGVQKEDIDANTLRKLQRHNVNIDDIDDRQMQKQCLGKTDLPITLPPPQMDVTTEMLSNKNGLKEVDPMTLQNMVEYLQFMRKEDKLESKHSSKNKLGLDPLTTLLSSYSNRETTQGKSFEDQSRETPLLKTLTVTKNNDENRKELNTNTELDNLMHILQTKTGKTTDAIRKESTVTKILKDVPKNINDVDYITKIVEDIMSKRQLNDLNTYTSRTSNFDNANKTSHKLDQMAREQHKNKTVSLMNYFLNNCKLGNFYGKTGYSESYDTISNVNPLISGTKITGTNIMCKKLEAMEKETNPEQNDNPVMNNILNELKKENQRVKPFEGEPPIGISSEQIPPIAYYNLNNGSQLTNKDIIRILQNQVKSVTPNRQSNRIKTDTYADESTVSDKERNKELKDALESQSKLYNKIFSNQRNLLIMYNTDKEKALQSELERQTNYGAFDQNNKPSIDTYIEKETDPSMYIDVKAHNLKTKQYDESPRGIKQSNNQQSHLVFDSLNQKEEIRDDNWLNAEGNKTQKTTNTLNRFEHEPIMENESKRPWFYAGLSNERIKPKMIGTQHGQMFIPIEHHKLSNPNEFRHKSYEKSWSPYFDTVGNDTTIIRIKEYVSSKDQRSISGESTNSQWIKSNAQSLSREMKEGNQKIQGIYQNENQYPIYIKDGSAEQLESKEDKKINQDHSQTIQETKTKSLPTAEYKRNRATYAQSNNKQSKKENTKMTERDEETEYITNKIRKKKVNHKFPTTPDINKMQEDTETPSNQFETNVAQDDLSSQNDTDDSIKPPSFPTNMIKDIANSIKDIVLRDLKTTAPATSLMTTTPTTTAIPQATSTISVDTTMASTTKEETPATTANQLLKIQDASKTLAQMIEMLEKITLMKDKILKPETVKHTQEVIYNTTKTVIAHRATMRRHEPNEINGPPYDKQYLQVKTDDRIPSYPQSLLPNFENREPYVSEAVQQKVENLFPFDPQSLQRHPENFVPYGQQGLQRIPENGLPYDSQSSNRHSEKQVPYNPQPLQRSIETNAPYISKDVQPRVDNRSGFDQVLQSNMANPTETLLPNDQRLQQNNLENRVPHDPQPLQYNQNNRMPNYLQPLQMNQETRTAFDQQVVQPKAENRLPYNPPTLQGHQENHGPQVPKTGQMKIINGMRYFPAEVQSKTENRMPYDTPGLQHNPENRVSYPLKQYVPNIAESQPENSLPYFPPAVRVKTEKHAPYDSNPSQYNTKSRTFDYIAVDPYHHSKIAYDSYLKEVQPVTQNILKPAPKPNKKVIMQTNSGEISPLKIVLQKPFVQNVVLTTQPPIIAHHSDETFNFRKPKPKSNQHQVELKENEMSYIKEHDTYVARHTHKGSNAGVPRSRKIKKGRDVLQHSKPQEYHEIERIHEKLERGDEWPHGREKIAKRVQRPIVKNTNYDDTHFRNFLQTQQKVNAMLEKILAAGKTRQISVEHI